MPLPYHDLQLLYGGLTRDLLRARIQLAHKRSGDIRGSVLKELASINSQRVLAGLVKIDVTEIEDYPGQYTDTTDP